MMYDFDDAITTEYPTARLSNRDTALDLTEPLHDPADNELTDPGLPQHYRQPDNTETLAATPRAKERR